MKAFVLYLDEIESTHQPANNAVQSAREHGLDAEPFKGYVPSRADDYIQAENLKPYFPGPKLYKIKWNKGGVRGCMISHLEMWKKCAALNETVVILEHDSVVVSATWKTDFDELLHLDKHRFIDPDPDLGKTPAVEKLEHYRKGQQQLQGTYGYVIKPKTAQRLIQGAYEDGLTAADMFVKDMYCTIQVVIPRAVKVANQESLTSDRGFYI